MSASILITGSTGTIGRATVAALHDLGQSARLGTRSQEAKHPAAGPNDEVVEFSFESDEVLDRALQGIETALLITPFVEESLQQTKRFVEAAKRAGVKHVVKLSAAGVNEEAPAAGIRNHALAEKFIAESGLGYTFLRPTFFMDNIFTFQRDTIVDDGAFYGAAAEGRIAYVSSADIGGVAAQALTEPDKYKGKTLDLTGPEALSEAALASLLSKTAGREIRYVDVGADGHRSALEAAGSSPFHIETLTFLETVKREGWAEPTTNTVEEVTGRRPTSYADFLGARRAQLS